MPWDDLRAEIEAEFAELGGADRYEAELVRDAAVRQARAVARMRRVRARVRPKIAGPWRTSRSRLNWHRKGYCDPGCTCQACIKRRRRARGLT